jgi:hypothetical protein
MGAAPLEYCHITNSKVFKRTFVIKLFQYSLLRLCVLNPFCCRAPICRHEACFNNVPVKLPTGIVCNALQPHVYSVALGDLSKQIDETLNVIDQLAPQIVNF